MTFVSHLFGFVAYALGRDYMSWFFILPTAAAIVYFVGTILSLKCRR